MISLGDEDEPAPPKTSFFGVELGFSLPLAGRCRTVFCSPSMPSLPAPILQVEVTEASPSAVTTLAKP
ncbi:hypothetical protein Caferm_05075 [Corynebacterium afermentans subsp. afermentans]|nr:hypothetical protein Caferm_05075 [Corynebacterium afermentans subsp. afermentans]